MSKIIYIHKRNGKLDEHIKKKLEVICDQLVPDNIESPPAHKIFGNDDTACAVLMHRQEIQRKDLSVFLGHIHQKESEQWDLPKTDPPDGSYAIFRNNDKYIEVLSDAAGSRTIWYFKNDDLFIASTSQRAILVYLGDFSFDEDTIPWMLSTGTLGPELSWDKRIKRLQPDSALLLNKKSFGASITQNKIVFETVKRSKNGHKKLLEDKIRQSIGKLNTLDFESWILPISGGYDSRAILCFLKEQIGLPEELVTVTWGLEKSLKEKGNDARIAQELSALLGVHHKYYHTDLSSEPINDILDRFIKCGEGRIDHLSAYMDGMQIWRKFYDENVSGIIRGDEGFGWGEVSSDLEVKLSVGCGLCSDFKNLDRFTEQGDWNRQALPENFRKHESETSEMWRDRLYHSFRLPTILSALSDIKLSYVEVINPLLSREILQYVRTLPDQSRTEKSMFKEIVDSISPNIPYANKGAIRIPDSLLRRKEIVEILRSEILSERSYRIFPTTFIDYLIDNIVEENKNSDMAGHKKNIKSQIRSVLPGTIRNWIRGAGYKPSIDVNKLAFRVFIVLKMHQIIQNDISNGLNNMGLMGSDDL